MTRSDEDLVRAARGGSVGDPAYAELARRYTPTMLRVAQRYLGVWQDAEDAVQDALLSGHARLGSLRDPAAVGGWLLAIVRQKCTQIHRRRRSDEPLTDAALRTPAAPATAPLELLEMLDSLPREDRELLWLRFHARMTTVEIARRLGQPEGTVTSSLFRTMRRLRQRFADDAEPRA